MAAPPDPSPLSPDQTPCTLLELMKIVLQDTKLTTKEKKQLLDELRKNNPSSSDRWTYRSAIWALAAIVIGTVVFIFILSKNQSSEGLIAIGSAAVGGLAGMLSTGGKEK
jgi:hypothetical protein